MAPRLWIIDWENMAIKDNFIDFIFLGLNTSIFLDLLLLWGSNWHLPQKVSLIYGDEYMSLLEQVAGESQLERMEQELTWCVLESCTVTSSPLEDTISAATNPSFSSTTQQFFFPSKGGASCSSFFRSTINHYNGRIKLLYFWILKVTSPESA